MLENRHEDVTVTMIKFRQLGLVRYGPNPTYPFSFHRRIANIETLPLPHDPEISVRYGKSLSRDKIIAKSFHLHDNSGNSPSIT
jgi:hypothetical protein